MPQKACERYIFHVMAYAYFFEMPQNRIISYSVSFQFENRSRVNFLKCSIFICSKMKLFDFVAFRMFAKK